VLYGLDMARKAIRDADLAVLVEGYMDVLMSHQVGVLNVVAGMGTALTDLQLGSSSATPATSRWRSIPTPPATPPHYGAWRRRARR